MAGVEDPLLQVTPDDKGRVDVTSAAIEEGYLVEYMGVPMLNTLAEALMEQEEKQVG